MKRTLVLIRHAKSSWSNPLQSDYERPLNDRGRKDAPDMGARLRKAGIIPDHIVSSAARRTRQTTAALAAALGTEQERIRYEEKLYHCVPAIIEEVIYSLPDEVHTAFIVAHNPGITEFVNQLNPDFYTTNMPTCGIVAVQVQCTSWHSFDKVPKEILLYDYPKNEHESE